MNQHERRLYLIDYLLREQGSSIGKFDIPEDTESQRLLLRALFNVRMPANTSEEFMKIQDAYLQEEIARKGVTNWRDLESREPGIYLWRGDITTLECDAIVNAANSQMLGCFQPNHLCIDNAIHTFAGIQLRLACAEYMNARGCEESTGMAMATPAFNLPSRYVLHTVGPIVESHLTRAHEKDLASCYRSCLDEALKKGLTSVAFCCISTGVFRFPADRAAQIAVETVREFRASHATAPEVVFNVFKESDYEIYNGLLG